MNSALGCTTDDERCCCACHDRDLFLRHMNACCMECIYCTAKIARDSVPSHEAKCGFLKTLAKNFYENESVQYTGIVLTDLREGYARVSVLAKKEFLVNCDMPPGRIVQGGFTAGVIPDFAGVLAAMTLTRGGHAALVSISFALTAKVVEGESIVAEAYAVRSKNLERTIEVECTVRNSEGEEKAKGKMTFREAKRSEKCDKKTTT